MLDLFIETIMILFLINITLTRDTYFGDEYE